MPQSPGLGFELLTSNQDSKHVTVNASALILEAVSIGVVVSQVNTPPASPTNGQLYIVGTAGTGAFLAQNNKLALYDSTTWYFYSPKTNQTLYNTALASYVRFGGSTWASVSLGGLTSPTTTKGDLIVRDATTDVRQPVGTDGQVLTADSTLANGLKWATPSPTTTKGDLIVRNATVDARQAIGSDGQVLTADSTLANGLKWASLPPSALVLPNIGVTLDYTGAASYSGNSVSTVFANSGTTAAAVGAAAFTITTSSSGFSSNQAGTYQIIGALTINVPSTSRVALCYAFGTNFKEVFLSSVGAGSGGIVSMPINITLSLAAAEVVTINMIAIGTNTAHAVSIHNSIVGSVANAYSRLFIRKL